MSDGRSRITPRLEVTNRYEMLLFVALAFRHNLLPYCPIGLRRSERPADPVVDSPIPELYEPVLFAFTTLAFRLRGFERVESPQGGFSVAQEWHCELP
jgi:hypothetical protein